MRSIYLGLVALGAALSFSFNILPAAAADAPEMQPLKLSKDCSKYSGGLPSFCTITESSLAALPAGTKVLYYGPVTGNPNFSSNNIVLDDGAGDTAMGNCIVDFAKPVSGLCAFYAGSGKLMGFSAVAKVTVDDKGLWHWEGSYSMAATK
jgi:hypothetical protein